MELRENLTTSTRFALVHLQSMDFILSHPNYSRELWKRKYCNGYKHNYIEEPQSMICFATIKWGFFSMSYVIKSQFFTDTDFYCMPLFCLCPNFSLNLKNLLFQIHSISSYQSTTNIIILDTCLSSFNVSAKISL